ncbi:MAG: hypothetical protein M9901_05470 [Lentimicrobium sp.]|jgi:hypothetical protein|nr:hypothetical protein [Lentimicrobium sp.]
MKSGINRILYLGYYVVKIDGKKLRKFLKYASAETGKPAFVILINCIVSSFKYNISLLDYFYFRFYEKSHSERLEWAGSGYMYEYHLIMNPKRSRGILENKIEFLEKYADFVRHKHCTLKELELNQETAIDLLGNPSGKIVLKLSTGQVGAEVRVFDSLNFTPESLIIKMKDLGFDLAEEYIVQHPALMDLSPSGLNTVRIFTQLDQGTVVFLGARLRVSVNSVVDNMGAGNLAAPVLMETGVVNGPAVYSDITRPAVSNHPVTGIAIEGFKIPFWPETLDMVTKAALLHPENKSIGWDIAITSYGPELVEGNHNWCKLLWQLPVKQGLKSMISKYI